MSKKKMSYIDVLKEAVNNYGYGHDTSDTVDTKGPFLDNILSYDGEGEITTYKDASSILERYYFDNDEGIESLQEVHDPEPAGADYEGNIQKDKDEIEKKVTEQEEEKGEDEDKEEKENEEEVEESEDLTETEKSIVEKLVEEMEDEGEKEEEEEVNEASKKNEPAGAPEKDAEKYVPEQDEEKDKEKDEEEEELDVDKELEEWGTGILDEQEEKEEEEKEEEESEEEKEEEETNEKANKDTKAKKGKSKNEAGPVGGPLGQNKSSGVKRGKYDHDDNESQVVEEQFEIFKKKIQESDDSSEDVDDIKGKDVIA